MITAIIATTVTVTGDVRPQAMISEEPKILQNPDFPRFCTGLRWGSLQLSPRFPSWWGRASCPVPQEPYLLLSALQASLFGSDPRV